MEEHKVSQADQDNQDIETDQEAKKAPNESPMTVQENLAKAKDILQNGIERGDVSIDSIREAQGYIQKALVLHKVPLPSRLFRKWGVLLYIVMAGLAEVVFIEFYCRWHGAYFLSLNLYDPTNVDVLSKVDFVNGPTTMSIAAEVLMWSSLGVWAKGTYEMARTFMPQKARYPYDIGSYIGTMVRNTSVAAIVVIILRLTKFSIFGVSLDSTSSYAFDATIGLSFLLGFFGDDAYRILSTMKDRLIKGIIETE